MAQQHSTSAAPPHAELPAAVVEAHDEPLRAVAAQVANFETGFSLLIGAP